MGCLYRSTCPYWQPLNRSWLPTPLQAQSFLQLQLAPVVLSFLDVLVNIYHLAKSCMQSAETAVHKKNGRLYKCRNCLWSGTEPTHCDHILHKSLCRIFFNHYKYLASFTLLPCRHVPCFGCYAYLCNVVCINPQKEHSTVFFFFHCPAKNRSGTQLLNILKFLVGEGL